VFYFFIFILFNLHTLTITDIQRQRDVEQNNNWSEGAIHPNQGSKNVRRRGRRGRHWGERGVVFF